jgi:hypothetical protein
MANTPLTMGPAPRSTDNVPSHRHQRGSVIRITKLPFTGTFPSHDEQILVLTKKASSL